MQLIVETETALDIETNMSTVEDLQSNKIDCINIEDDNKNKCNGNKEVTTTINNEESNQIISEIEAALADTPMDVENNEAQLSNVDLSTINGKQNCLEEDDAQNEESLDLNLEKKTNGISTVKNDLVNQPDDEEEEDYLEDDIISIRLPYDEPAIVENVPDKVLNGTSLDENSQADDKDDIEIVEDEIERSSQSKNNSLTEDKDIIELLEESDDSVETKLEEALQDDKDVVEVIEELDKCLDNKAEKNIQEDKDDIEVIEELQDPLDYCEKETSSSLQEKGNEAESIRESVDPIVESEIEKEPVTQDVKDVPEITEDLVDGALAQSNEGRKSETHKGENPQNLEESKSPHIQCKDGTESLALDENNEMITDQMVPVSEEIETGSPTEHSKQDSNQIVKTATETPVDCDSKTEALEEDSKCQIEITEKVEDTVDDRSNDIDLTTEAKENTVQHENKLTPQIEDEVEYIEETDASSAQCKDNPIPSAEVAENDEGENSNSTHSVKKPNTDSLETAIVLKGDAMDVEEIAEQPKSNIEAVDSPLELKDDMDVEEVAEKGTDIKEVTSEVKESSPIKSPELNQTSSVKSSPSKNIIDKPIICKLSNTLDILSDDDEEETPIAQPPKAESPKVQPPQVTNSNGKQSIQIEEDDDIMVIDEDQDKIEVPTNITNQDSNNKIEETPTKADINTDSETGEKTVVDTNESVQAKDPIERTSPTSGLPESKLEIDIDIKEKTTDTKIETPEPAQPLVPDNFLQTAKKKLSDMTRDELEEFCILKIVESIVDRSGFSDIKNKLKTMEQGLEEYKKKATLLARQNRDLQVVLKSVQEEQKKATGDTPITPLKITRSVGILVMMDKVLPRKKGPQPQNSNNKNPNNPQNRILNPQGPRLQKPVNQSIPVPRLVPANSPALKAPSTISQLNQINSPIKNINTPNGIIKNPSPTMKAEKRPFNKMSSSVTVDLTDDEPPAKMPGGPKNSPATPVRLVPPQNLMAPQRQAFGTAANNPRKVYIPISGPQNPPLRPGQTIMLKAVPAPGLRPRCPTQVTNSMRMNRVAARHPAPLPFVAKQYQPPNWKPLPPAPDLKLSKVENGIVISWKIEDIPEDSYEQVASYQIFAYQETKLPPSTGLWKKIGDVKALPLPMACTLTQFMAGHKYYFAVRAVDIKSRYGDFSLPGSILLLNKNLLN